MSVYDIPPGEPIGPYHFEWTDEEWLIALEGHVTIRTPEGELGLDPGEVVCFPVGSGGAHQARNATDVPVRVAVLSTMNEFGIVEYLEDEQVGIWAGEEHYVLDRPKPHKGG
ncbi:MAG: cupin domain-containing protein [Actinobacteria bacterium]|nr:cupin domain-containing protein [Actinomycetota bacterium]